MTKPITSVALMMLHERGLFQLSDPVHKVIPSWRGHRVWISGAGEEMITEAPVRPITFRDMLCHTGGLTYGSFLNALTGAPADHPVDDVYARVGVGRSAHDTLEDFVAKLGQVPLRYQPGERWQYSLSTDVCAYLVQALSGKRFDRFRKEEIFEPLGMTETAHHVAPENHARLAACYRRGADKSVQLVDDPARSSLLHETSFFGGGSGLTGTIADYHRFCEMLRRGGELDGVRILSPRTIELMRLNHLPGGGELGSLAIGSFSETAYDGVGFGLGFAMTLDQTRTQSLGAADYYWGGAASTIFWVDPVEDLCVIFLTQLLPSSTFNFRGQLKSIVYGAISE
jgi:CubicO group peptidase (beta-lactamase class C family)